MEFKWAPRKAASNLARHGVSFDGCTEMTEIPEIPEIPKSTQRKPIMQGKLQPEDESTLQSGRDRDSRSTVQSGKFKESRRSTNGSAIYLVPVARFEKLVNR